MHTKMIIILNNRTGFLMKTFLIVVSAFILSNSILYAQTVDYYPLEVGNYWIYSSNPPQSNSPLSTYKVTVKRFDVVNGNECFEVGSVNTDTGEAQSSRWRGKDNNGTVFEYAFGTDKYILTEWDPPHVVIPGSIVKGLSWENRIKGQNEAYPDSVFYAYMIYRIESIRETVTVPAGTFDNCIKIRLIDRNYEGNIANKLDLYYAKGVGRVMTVVEKPGGKVIRGELIEYGNVSDP